jgi:hypothetical protein
VYTKPAAGAGRVVANSVAELKTNVVPDWAAVTEPAAVRVVTATVPVTVPVKLPIKPFVDVTGPEKVVDAMMYSLHTS